MITWQTDGILNKTGDSSRWVIHGFCNLMHHWWTHPLMIISIHIINLFTCLLTRTFLYVSYHIKWVQLLWTLNFTQNHFIARNIYTNVIRFVEICQNLQYLWVLNNSSLIGVQSNLMVVKIGSKWWNIVGSLKNMNPNYQVFVALLLENDFDIHCFSHVIVYFEIGLNRTKNNNKQKCIKWEKEKSHS